MICHFLEIFPNKFYSCRGEIEWPCYFTFLNLGFDSHLVMNPETLLMLISM